jgi:amidase
MSELFYKSAKQIALGIKKKSFSSVEVATAHLKQIERVNPHLNALMHVNPESILAAAQNADNLLVKKQNAGPLLGVPFTVKDNIITKDLITSSGSKAYLSHTTTLDATVVSRIKAAGGILLGKTNLPDFALCWETDSSAFGRTNNPYDLKRSPGGSSGGEAAIIAAGGSPLGLANDGGGSIRLPAHYCGIAGYRPSIGLVPTTGLFPSVEKGYASGILGRFLSVGPMARFVEDLIYCLPVIAGSDNIDPNSLNSPLNPLSSINKKLRVAYYPDELSEINSPINKALKNVSLLLSDYGMLVEENKPECIADSWSIFSELLCADGGAGIKSLLTSLNVIELPQACEEAIMNLPSKELSISEFNTCWTKWDNFRYEMIHFMKNYDLIISPVTSSAALLHSQLFTDTNNFKSINYLAAFSLMGWPCVVVRAGTTDEGLPIGVQIVAKHWCDYAALNVAKLIEEMFGGWEAPSFLLKRN